MGSVAVTLSFFAFGVSCYVSKHLLLIATEDIMAGTLIESSNVMTCYAIGDLISKAIGTVLLRKIKLPSSMVLAVLLWIITWLLIVLGENPTIRLVGSFFAGIMNGFPNVIAMTLISLYDNIGRSISAYAAGGSTATILIGFLYTGSTTWLCFPPRLTFAIIFPITLLMVPFYVILNHGPLKKHQIQDGVQYSELRPSGKKIKTKSRVYNGLLFFHKTFPFLSFSLIDRFIYRLTTTSTVTTLTFNTAPFRVRDHFQFYLTSGDIGKILGSVIMMIASCICSSRIKSSRIRIFWPLIAISIGHFIFFLSASWYRFVPNVYIILTFCFTRGIVLMIIYTLSYSSAAVMFTNPQDKSLAMNIIQFGTGLGSLIAALAGLFVEENLHQHCTNELLLGKNCLARFTTSLGWTKNSGC